MNGKSKLGILSAVVILAILLGPMLAVPVTSTSVQHDPDWYVTVDGNLSSDYYSLYPYSSDSISVGFSKYGEMISFDPETGIGVGLQYPGYEVVGTYDQREGTSRDPFADEGIHPEYWLNGWYIDIRYDHRVYKDRHIWAFAMFADMAEHGWDWRNNVEDPYGTPHGGRKTNKVASTEPLQIIYHGPRRFIAKSVTHIYDQEGSITWPVVDVILTLVFDKVKKQVIVYKDVKLTIDAKILETPVNVQFSNRGEWDLGGAPDWKSYAHFYHQTLETCYGENWHIAKYILREYKHTVNVPDGETWYYLQVPNDTQDEPPYYGYPVAPQSEYVYVDGEWLDPEQDYTIDYSNGNITFTSGIEGPATIEVYYKLRKVEWDSYDEEWEKIDSIPHQYDLAQIISADGDYVGWAAFWPVLSDYTPDGWGRVLDPLYNVDDEDMLPIGTGEPDIPFIIGEWDFLLAYTDKDDWPSETVPQFRAVSVYGVTDLNDGEDEQMDGMNWIDQEVGYQLDQVFNPWSIVKAVHKDKWRLVNKFTGDGDTDSFMLWHTYPFDFMPILNGEFNWEGYYRWGDYCVASEKVLVDGVLMKPDDDYIVWTPDELDPSSPVYINFTDAPDDGAEIKVLFSLVDHYWLGAGDRDGMGIIGPERPFMYGMYEWLVVGRDSAAVDSAGASMVSEYFDSLKGIGVRMSGLDMQDEEFGPTIPFVLSQMRPDLLPDRAGYRDDDWGPNTGRLAFKDDWCCHTVTIDDEEYWVDGVPIASSNIIVVGGFYANLAAEYLNDFTDAYFDPATGEIVALSCWNQNRYKAVFDEETGEQLKGYAVITTFKDLNGTEFFAVWGYTGQDTYWATWALWHGGLGYKLQEEPLCATTLIIEFDYTQHAFDRNWDNDRENTFFKVVEVLGTISEYNAYADWPDGWWFEGPAYWGIEQPPIHPDP